MTQQSYNNYIANVHCCKSSLASTLITNEQLGRSVSKSEWSMLKILTAYTRILESYKLPHIETTIKTEYDDAIITTLTPTTIQIVLGNLDKYVAIGQTCIVYYAGVSYQGVVTTVTYSSGQATIVMTTTTTSLVGVIGTFIYYMTNTLNSDDEIGKNCLTPDDMCSIANHINHICSSCYAPDFILTTN